MAAPWQDWQEYHVEGFGPVTRVELVGPFANEARRIASERGIDPNVLVNVALAAGLSILMSHFPLVATPPAGAPE